MTAGAHAGRRRRRWRALVALVLGIALTGGGVWAAVALNLLPESVSGDAACTPTTVEVAVVPALAPTVEKAARALADDCRDLDVVRRTTARVERGVSNGEPLPDVWIPDAVWPLEGLAAAGAATEVVSPGVASTPVVLVGGPAADDATASWGDALQSGQVALPDPTTTTVGVMALLASQSEADAVGRTAEEATALLAPVAQAYGERRADGVTDDVSLTSITASAPRLVPATEQDFIAAHRVNDALQAIVPRSGAMRMTFPVVASSEADAAAVDAAGDLVAWFEGRDGRRELVAAGLRAGDGQAARSGGVGKVSYLEMPESSAVAAEVRSWAVLSVPSSVLAVFDVSGSMDFLAGDKSRIQLASEFALAALEIFPDHARVGLWAFSIDQGGPGQDWRVLEPVRRLDALVAGSTQRQVLSAWSTQLTTLTTGGTGLYDTALAAYRQAVRDYDEAYSNSVILLTDGANDDPSTIGERALMRGLKAARDPQRPVRIIGIAISQDADFAALRRIALATGGEAYLAEDPHDITDVFGQALAAR